MVKFYRTGDVSRFPGALSPSSFRVSSINGSRCIVIATVIDGVSCTEMVSKTSVLIMKEAYDNHWLWTVSTDTIRYSGELDLLPILGNKEKVDEFLHMLLVIERTNFIGLYPTFRKRGEKSDEIPPKSMGTGADWMYYDPVARRVID